MSEKVASIPAHLPAGSFSTPSPLLRRVLLADSMLTATSGLLLLFRADRVASLLGLPAAGVFWVGVLLLPVAALELVLAARERLHRPLVLMVIAGNLFWAIGSLGLPFIRWGQSTGAAADAILVGQALVVLVIAVLEYLGLRRSKPIEA